MMKLEFMVHSKEGGQNFYNRQKEDRITKFALKLLSDWETSLQKCFCLLIFSTVFGIICFYVKHW